MESNQKEKITKKELMMIIVVIALACGLTVLGFNYLINGCAFTSETVSNESSIQFIDNATEDEPIEEPEPVAPAPAEPPAATTSEPPAVTAPQPARQTPAPAPVQPPVPAPKPPAPQPIKSDIPTTSPTKGKFQIQLFASKNESSAKNEAQKYKDEYSDVYVVRAVVDSEIWFRARCCSVETREEAAAVKSAIEQKYKIVPIIITVE